MRRSLIKQFGGNNCLRYFYSGIQKIKERFSQTRSYTGIVLMFHQVNNNSSEWEEESFSISEDGFEALLRRLLNGKHKIRPISELIETYCEGVYITFDDGYKDLYTKAYPILRRLEVPFAIFVTTDYIGKENYLTLDMLNTLASDDLCTVGSHTKSHPLLRYESEEISKEEILDSKIILESVIQKPVEYFAYPYGSIYACSKRDVNLVRSCGYKLAFSTVNAHLSDNAIPDRFFVPRINVNEKNYCTLEVINHETNY